MGCAQCAWAGKIKPSLGLVLLGQKVRPEPKGWEFPYIMGEEKHRYYIILYNTT